MDPTCNLPTSLVPLTLYTHIYGLIEKYLVYITGVTYGWDMWRDVEDSSMNWAAFVGGVALRYPAVVFLVPPKLHPSVLKPCLYLRLKKSKWLTNG